MSAPLRELVADAIEGLVALLDAIDGNPDLEAEVDFGDTDDEPVFEALAAYRTHYENLETHRGAAAVAAWCERDDRLFREVLSRVPKTAKGLSALVELLLDLSYADLAERVAADREDLVRIFFTIRRSVAGLQR